MYSMLFGRRYVGRIRGVRKENMLGVNIQLQGPGSLSNTDRTVLGSKHGVLSCFCSELSRTLYSQF